MPSPEEILEERNRILTDNPFLSDPIKSIIQSDYIIALFLLPEDDPKHATIDDIQYFFYDDIQNLFYDDAESNDTVLIDALINNQQFQTLLKEGVLTFSIIRKITHIQSFIEWLKLGAVMTALLRHEVTVEAIAEISRRDVNYNYEMRDIFIIRDRFQRYLLSQPDGSDPIISWNDILIILSQKNDTAILYALKAFDYLLFHALSLFAIQIPGNNRPRIYLRELVNMSCHTYQSLISREALAFASQFDLYGNEFIQAVDSYSSLPTVTLPGYSDRVSFLNSKPSVLLVHPALDHPRLNNFFKCVSSRAITLDEKKETLTELHFNIKLSLLLYKLISTHLDQFITRYQPYIPALDIALELTGEVKDEKMRKTYEELFIQKPERSFFLFTMPELAIDSDPNYGLIMRMYADERNLISHRIAIFLKLSDKVDNLICANILSFGDEIVLTDKVLIPKLTDTAVSFFNSRIASKETLASMKP